MAKRSLPDTSPFDPQDDIRREQEFFDEHAAPTQSEYYKDITTVRSDAEVKNRKELIRRASNRRSPTEDFDFENPIDYISSGLGEALSNILLSYIVSNKVNASVIDYKVYHPRDMGTFSIQMMDADNTEMASELIENNKNTLKLYLKKWFDQSEMHAHIKNFAKSFEGKAGSAVIRRCTILGITVNYEMDELQDHELLLYWQIRVVNEDIMLEFGVCDNLNIWLDYKVIQKRNYNFHELMQEALKEFLQSHSDVPIIAMKFRAIKNSLPGTILNQKYHKNIDYQCMSITRRAILYFAIFYDIFKLDANKNMEHLVPCEEFDSTEPSSKPQLSYKKNLMAYTHYMNRMIDWLLKSPLIWPEFDSALPVQPQTKPTRARPVCSVLFAEGYKNSSPCEMYRNFQSVLEKDSLFIEMNEETAYITLYNNFDKQRQRYYFQWEGDEVFKPEPRPTDAPQRTCNISASVNTQDITAILYTLHARLLQLELVMR